MLFLEQISGGKHGALFPACVIKSQRYTAENMKCRRFPCAEDMAFLRFAELLVVCAPGVTAAGVHGGAPLREVILHPALLLPPSPLCTSAAPAAWAWVALADQLYGGLEGQREERNRLGAIPFVPEHQPLGKLRQSWLGGLL